MLDVDKEAIRRVAKINLEQINPLSHAEALKELKSRLGVYTQDIGNLENAVDQYYA
jgi:hypothetical protein